MKRLVILLSVLVHSLYLFGQQLTNEEKTEIKLQSQYLIDSYESLLNFVADPKRAEFEKRNTIRISSYFENPRRVFFSKESQIEKDLTPDQFKNGSDDFDPAADYLLGFLLFFKKNSVENPVEIEILGITEVFERAYIGNQVLIELNFKGEGVDGNVFGRSKRLVETKALKDSRGNWNVFIASILFFDGDQTSFSPPVSPDSIIPAAPLSKNEVDSDTDGVPDRLDECPNEFGLGPKGCPDSDGDGVPDKDDKCINLPGSTAAEGCPDSDNDGIQDHLDNCPYTPGPLRFSGCPDSDRDGIVDSLDRCKYAAGLLKFQGCPDTDGDGIPDIDDNCKLQAGLEKYGGCPEPDADGDGIPDKIDECKYEKGTAQFNGCPDTDGDLIPDHVDACKFEKGPKKHMGCPDNDGDGVPNKDDVCPTVKGKKKNQGCPTLGGAYFLSNSYLAFNYRLFSKSQYHPGQNFDEIWEDVQNKANADFSGFNWGEFGVSFYAPIGFYFFGFNDTRSNEVPTRTYQKSDIEGFYPQFQSMNIPYAPLQFQQLSSSGLSYHFGVNFSPFPKKKFLRHLFFKVGFTNYEGYFWAEYSGLFPDIIPPSLSNGNYAISVSELDKGVDYELGLALVYPFINLEVNYFHFDNSFNVLGGVNFPFRYFLSWKKRKGLYRKK